MKNLILCGLPGSGKTAVAERVASRLLWVFVDTDRLIEGCDSQKRSCRMIAQQDGDNVFRKLESSAVQSLCGCRQAVIATGGGTCISNENRAILKSLGKIIYLKAMKPKILLERICANGIPSFLESSNLTSSFDKLVQQRCALYETVCDHIILIDNETMETIAERVLDYHKSLCGIFTEKV